MLDVNDKRDFNFFFCFCVQLQLKKFPKTIGDGKQVDYG